ncbi:MAG: V-type ATPase 116kDa subunit family protein [candidate division WOR-3 bacterium]
MAIAKVKKVLILTHKEEKEEVLKGLQRLGIFHLAKRSYEEITIQKEDLNKIDEVIDFLNPYLPKEEKNKKVLIEEEFLKNLKTEEITKIVNLFIDKKRNLIELDKTIKTLKEEIEQIIYFKDFSTPIEELKNFKKFKFLFGKIKKNIFLNIENILEKDKSFYKIINETKEDIYLFIGIYQEFYEELRNRLISQGLEVIDLFKYQGKISDNIERLKKEIKSLEEKKEEVLKELKASSSYLKELKIYYDYLFNEKIRKEIEKGLFLSKRCVLITGFVKERDIPILEGFLKGFKALTYSILEPKEEEIPVALENRKIFQPFEIVLELYGMPNPEELDPTPFLAPFFAIFFALCLTDAGYGLVLTFLSLYLMKKFPKGKKFLTLLLICSIFTVFAGAFTNGWFGDFFDKFNLSFLKNLKDRLILFDPFKNPMVFFILSLILGYLHLNYGFLLEIYDSFRIKNPLPAIFNEGAWFLVLNSLVLYILFKKFYFLLTLFLGIAFIICLSKMEKKLFLKQFILSLIIFNILLFFALRLKFLPNLFFFTKYLVLLLTAIFFLISLRQEFKKINLLITILVFILLLFYELKIVNKTLPIIISLVGFFIFKENRKLLKKLIWGAYNLYGGTSFVGVVLSYIRLMALGMVTAGIAMAINTIASLAIKIPILGIIAALIILLIGHSYNLAVNVLGAFVHTLRLNYVEFFPRFFSGGGIKFSPLKMETKYVEIKS